MEFDYHVDLGWDQPLFQLQTHFVLADPIYTDDFMIAASEIFPEGTILNDYSSRFSAIMHSTSILLEITNVMMWGAIGAAVIVLTLTITLFLHDRRHEIGIYLSLGERKNAILLQFLSEIMIVSLIGITIALFIGNSVSNQLSHSMLLDEIVTFEEERDLVDALPTDMELAFGHHQLTHDYMLAAFDTSLSAETVVIFYAVGIGISVAATIVPIAYIVKLNPKKVLM